MKPADPNKDKKIEEVIKKAATQFLLVEASPASLLTVTHVLVSPKFEHATVYFTVFPDSKEANALEFAKRKRSEFKEYLRSETKLPRVPFVDFEIDLGEKNRQRIDELSNQ